MVGGIGNLGIMRIQKVIKEKKVRVWADLRRDPTIDFLQSHMHLLIFEAFIAFSKFHESVHTIFQSFKLGVLLNIFFN